MLPKTIVRAVKLSRFHDSCVTIWNSLKDNESYLFLFYFIHFCYYYYLLLFIIISTLPPLENNNFSKCVI